MFRSGLIASCILASLGLISPVLAQSAIYIPAILELSGAGAVSGTNFRDGMLMAIDEINAKGGILGKKMDTPLLDTQSDAGISRAQVQKVLDNKPYVIIGPVFSGSVLVDMLLTQQAEIPEIVGGEAAAITQKGNPYIFRTSFGQQFSMPKIANYMRNGIKARTVGVLWVNNDFGKGGRDNFNKEMNARDIKVVADISTESGQADFSADVVKLKSANADAIFVYLNEEESARFLREARKQGLNKPLIGETTLLGQKVIDLAGGAANGVRGHVGLTIDAPIPAVQEFAERFKKRLDDPARQWKISDSDYKERDYWKDYTEAFEDVLTRTSAEHAPWFIIPSNHKWFRNLAISQIITRAMEEMNMQLPKPTVNLTEIRREYHQAAGAEKSGHSKKK